MTGFARIEDEGFVWEIRSLNLRGLEVRLKLPDAFEDLESELRETVLEKVARGRVEGFLRYEANAQAQDQIDAERLESLRKLIGLVQSEFPDSAQPDPLDVLRWSGVLTKRSTPSDDDRETVKRAFNLLMDEFIAHRQREGKSMENALCTRLDDIESTMSTIDQHRERQVELVRQRLKQRISRLDVEVDSQRLEQEVAFLAQRVDFDEERDRLLTHVNEMRACFGAEGAHGRRMGFLAQEMSREANTLASKTVVPECATLAVDMKVLVDQIREQVQNVE